MLLIRPLEKVKEKKVKKKKINWEERRIHGLTSVLLFYSQILKINYAANMWVMAVMFSI